MAKATEDEKQRFRSLVDDAGDVRPMFGQLGAFVNGNMYAGMYGPTLGVKLSAADLAELGEVEGTGPFLPVKPMAAWLALPESFGDAEIRAWFARARQHVATLPPK